MEEQRAFVFGRAVSGATRKRRSRGLSLRSIDCKVGSLRGEYWCLLHGQHEAIGAEGFCFLERVFQERRGRGGVEGFRFREGVFGSGEGVEEQKAFVFG